MITLDQIRLLEEKVENAVLKIAGLIAENEELRRTLTDISMQNSELAKKNVNLVDLLSKHEEAQERIEKGIISALDRLNDVENTVLSSTDSFTASAGESSAESFDLSTDEETEDTTQIESSDDFESDTIGASERDGSDEKKSFNQSDNQSEGQIDIF